MRVVAGNQLTLELQTNVRQRFTTLRECVHWTVLNDPRGPKNVAADCDLSLSELTRRLSPTDGDPRSCDVNLMVRVMHSTGDHSPLHWLMSEFLQDQDTKRRAAVEQISSLLPHMVALMAEAGPAIKAKR